MTTNKLLIGLGIVAVAAIGIYAALHRSPGRDNTSGSIGMAAKYHTEQISDQDVVLADPEVQALMQTDFFYQLVTDKDFQKSYLDGTAGKFVAQVPASLAAANVEALGNLGRALSLEEFRQHVAAGRFDLAEAAAKTAGISITAEDLNRFGLQNVVQAKSMEQLNALGRALTTEAVAKHIAMGKFDLAEAAAKTAGIPITAADLNRYGVKSLSGHSVQALNNLGRALLVEPLAQHIAMGKFDLAGAAAKTAGIPVTSTDLGRLNISGLQAKGLEHLSDLGKALNNDTIRQHIVAGKFDLAGAAAKTAGIPVTSTDLGRFNMSGLSRSQVSSINELGRAFLDDAVSKQLVAGNVEAAADAAKTKGIMVSPADFNRYNVGGLGFKKTEDVAALGRLLQAEPFQKMLPRAGAMEKVMTQSAMFKNAVKSGDMAKLSEVAKHGIQ